MTCDLLRRENRLLDARQGRDLAQLGQLHVLQALGILGQAYRTHAALNVVHKPALTIHDDDRNALSCDVAHVLQDSAARHDVLAHTLALDALLAYLDRADGGKRGLEGLVGRKIGLAVALLGAVDRLEDADRLGLFLDFVIFGDEHYVRGAPVEFILVDDLGPACRVVAPSVFVGLACHAGDNKAEFGIRFVLALRLEIEEH